MPLPKPNPDESHSDFMSRCMLALEGEFPDAEQRRAICMKQHEGHPMESRNTEHGTRNTDSIQARASFNAPETAAGEFMFMPAGVQQIHAFQGGNDVSLSVLVDRAGAEAMQAQLTAANSRSAHRAYFDFDHDDKAASFWPKSFTWREGSGIWVQGEWSEAGKAAIEGRTYRGFSPVFHVDHPKRKPARIVLNPEPALNMGGLLNNPAFKNNLPLWAKDAGQPSSAKKPQHTVSMKKTKAELEAEIQQVNTDLADLKGRTVTPEVTEAITAKNSDLELLEAQLEAAIARDEASNAERELTAIRAADAQRAVADAIERGVFGPKDEEMKSFWSKEITETPAKAAVLGKMPGRITLGRKTDPIKGKDSDAIVPRRIEIVRADHRNVMQNLGSICARQAPGSQVAYRDRPKIAKEIAAIYAREILPRYNDPKDDIPLFDLVPIMGANTLGTLAQTLVATRTLELLTQELPMIKAITTDFSDQIVSYLDTSKTRIVGIPAVATFNTTTGWPTPSAVTTTDVSITYNQFKGVPIQFLGHEIAGTIRRLFDELAPAQAYALGDDMVDYVLALITAANFTNTVTSAGLGTFARSTVIDIGTALRKRGVPSGAMNRSLILSSDYFGALAKDNALVTLASNSGQDRGIITEGVLPNVHGFKVIDAPTLPATAIGTGTLAGFGFSKSALVLATRLSADYVNAIPGAGNGNLTVVTTPAGFSANLVQFVDHVGATANSRLEVIYGASAGQDNAGQILQAP